MRFFHNLFTFFILFTSTFLSFGLKEAFASNYINQINIDSSKEKIEKLQNIFTELDLYNGEIDGNFSSIEDELINYQVENKIIPHKNHEEAGYFGNDTMTSFEKKYGQKFLKLKEKYLKYESLKENEEGYFVVTAYYSPIRGQAKYQRGSYLADIRLNGGGNTASGKTPFAGVFAAPRNYKFGTKIYLDGIGVGVVEDRGGAIVNAGEKGQVHDRIDIWVGYGDEGRERAIKWGRRKVKGYVVSSDKDVNIEFDNSVVSKYIGLKIDAENPNTKNVRKLQELFKELKLYNGEINGNYDDIKDKLISFQKENGISSHLGYFGTKTYSALSKKYGKNGLFISKTIDEEKNENLPLIGANLEQEKTKIVDLKEDLSESEKKKIKEVRNIVIKNYGKKYNNDTIKVKLAISELKTELTKMIPVMRKEKQKLILAYLVEIL